MVGLIDDACIGVLLDAGEHVWRHVLVGDEAGAGVPGGAHPNRGGGCALISDGMGSGRVSDREWSVGSECLDTPTCHVFQADLFGGSTRRPRVVPVATAGFPAQKGAVQVRPCDVGAEE